MNALASQVFLGRETDDLSVNQQAGSVEQSSAVQQRQSNRNDHTGRFISDFQQQLPRRFLQTW